MEDHSVVPHEAWVAARRALLVEEKEFTRARDELSRRRRELPWEAVPKDYTFMGAAGEVSLAELFDGRSQLIVYHFMFGPDWPAGCPACSFWADNFDKIIVHLNQRDVSMVAVSHAPYDQLAAYRTRMGWGFSWFSSFANDFNFDYHVSFTPADADSGASFYNFTTQETGTEREGISVFFKDQGGRMFRTYSTYARGLDMLNTAYHYLDLVPLGRAEGNQPMSWVRRHDEYPGAGAPGDLHLEAGSG